MKKTEEKKYFFQEAWQEESTSLLYYCFLQEVNKTLNLEVFDFTCIYAT